GLVINNFRGFGIVLSGGSSTIQGNYIGTTLDGTDAIVNGGGIAVNSPGNLIGGTTAAARNVISGNTAPAIQVQDPATGAAADNNRIVGNYIGTNADGTVAIGNGSGVPAVQIITNGNTVGGTAPEERNVISGNIKEGVSVDDSGNTVAGN